MRTGTDHHYGYGYLMGTKTCIRIRTHIGLPAADPVSGSGSKLKLAFDHDRIPSALSTCDEETAIPLVFLAFPTRLQSYTLRQPRKH